jgi:tetratricopeptide (TPR) repeat protein
MMAEYIESVEGIDAARVFLLEQRSKISDHQALSRLYEALGENYRKQKRSDLAIAAYERALGYDVHNKDARFQLAYIYGDIEPLQGLAVRHYRILLRQDPSYWSAENNLGAQYEKLGLHHHKIQAWETALGRNDSYALGNLMFSYIGAGFLDRAESLYNDAQSHVRSGERVVAAYSHLRKIRDEEASKLDGIREGGEAIWRELVREQLDFSASAESWVGDWKDGTGKVSLKISRSGEYLSLEQIEGNCTRKGLMKPSEPLAIVSVTEQYPGSTNALSLLSRGGPYDAGAMIVYAVESGLKIIRTKDNSFLSTTVFSRLNI